MSNAFPFTVLSDCGRSTTTMSALSFFAKIKANVAPVCPAPIIEIFYVYSSDTLPIYKLIKTKTPLFQINYNIEITEFFIKYWYFTF